MLIAITTRKLHRTNPFQRGCKGSGFLPQALTSTTLSLWIRVPDFNLMRLATSFLLCSSAEHKGWDSELQLPHSSKSPVLTDPFTEVPGHCVFTPKSEKIFLTVGRLLRYGEGTKSSDFWGQTVSDKNSSLLLDLSLQHCFRTSCLDHKNNSCYAGKTANMYWNNIAIIYLTPTLCQALC